MIMKTFYDEEDYMVVLNMLNGVRVNPDDIERVKTRQLFLLAIGDHNCKSVKEVCDTFKKVGMIKCPSCGKQFKKIDKYTYKPACKCFKNSKLLLSVG